MVVWRPYAKTLLKMLVKYIICKKKEKLTRSRDRRDVSSPAIPHRNYGHVSPRYIYSLEFVIKVTAMLNTNLNFKTLRQGRFGRKVRISRDMMCNFVAELPKVWSKENLIWQLMRGNLSIKTVRHAMHAGQGKKKSSFLF